MGHDGPDGADIDSAEVFCSKVVVLVLVKKSKITHRVLIVQK